ncbi:MAG: outer membrane protein transport protein [Gammaproteobacteria bacterium]|nr:outer membrane protein transport protein [Gammaproteobacteria bacterium]
MSGLKRSLISMTVAGILASPAVYATNGMNLEGYGPVATGMGGASMAYENGSAAVMNNPATIGLMNDGQSRLEVAIGSLAPDITSSMTGMSDADSSGGPYMMPAVGWTKREGKLTYGFGMFAQGGMGTDYAADSIIAAGTNEAVRSEVGVGRMLVPLTYEVDSKLTVGGTIDFVWAGMDLKMAMSGAQFMDFMPTTVNPLATNAGGTASGTLVSAFAGAVGVGMMNPANPVNTTRFDFSNSSDYTGEASSTGYGAKLGFVYKVNNKLTLGGTYHLETSLGDLKTSNASMTMSANFDDNVLNQTWNPGVAGVAAGTYTAVPVDVTGRVSVVDFQWPATIGFGGAYQMNDKLLIAADIKSIRWSDVMDSFRMTFTSDSTQTGLAAGFADVAVDFEMFQKWDDQTVINIGASYQVDSALTVRGGLNLSSNPVPDAYLNPLFPATIENHLTGGVGYKIDQAQAVDFSLTYAPEVDATSGSGVAVSHSQMNWQFMYTNNF